MLNKKGASMNKTENALNNPLILVVDDDNRLRKLLQKFLTDSGYRVFTAADTAQADEMRGWYQFDLMVVDVMMPCETGLEFTARLRKAGENVPVLMLTAMGETDDRINGLEARVQQVDGTAQSAAGAAATANQRLDQLTPRVDSLEQQVMALSARGKRPRN